MIELTRLNGHPLYLNCDLIKWAEAAPDTVLTLVNDEKVVVRESCATLVERVRKERLLLLTELNALIAEPERMIRAAPVTPIPGPWSQAATTEGRNEAAPDDRQSHAPSFEDTTG